MYTGEQTIRQMMKLSTEAADGVDARKKLYRMQ